MAEHNKDSCDPSKPLSRKLARYVVRKMGGKHLPRSCPEELCDWHLYWLGLASIWSSQRMR